MLRPGPLRIPTDADSRVGRHNLRHWTRDTETALVTPGIAAEFHLLINPAAGEGKSVAAGSSVATLLRESGAPVTVTHTVSVPHARSLAADAAARGAVVVAVGGDGTVASLASTLLAGGTLGIVPCGRGNDLARQLGIPNDPAAITHVLLSEGVRAIDVIEVDGRVVLGSVYAGIDSLTSELVNRLHWLPQPLQYPVAALWAITVHRPTGYRLGVDGVEYRLDAHTVVVANSGYYGSGMHIAPTARLDDGLLNVVTIAAVSRLRLIQALRRVYSGSHVHLAEVRVFTGRDVEIASAGPVTAYGDGEPIGALPVRARVHPSALRVLAPAPTP